MDTGLIVSASNEAELAAALSNAIARVAARHLMQEMTMAQVLQLPAISGTALAWHWSHQEQRPNMELAGMKSMHEKETDQLAMQYLWTTGYDPSAYITALKKLPTPPSELRDRLQSAMIELQSLPDKHPSQLDSVEFEAVKSHLLSPGREAGVW